MASYALLLALFWGLSCALVLQFTPVGRFLARRRAWLAVVIGVGGDLLLLLIFLPVDVWIMAVGVVAASSIGLVIRSLHNEWIEEQETIAAYRRETR